MQPVNLKQFQSQVHILLLIVIAFFFLSTTKSAAQINCGGEVVDIACLKNPSANYQCINGDYDSPMLYGAQLLTPTQAQNTPQYLIVKGMVTFTEDYTFAPGSEIIFVDNNSAFKAFNFRQLMLSGSYLHGCTKLWAGVEVLQGATIIAENSTFEDARSAIILRNFARIEATKNIFRKNVCGILGHRFGFFLSIFLASDNGISGNTFWGNDQLLEPIVPASIDAGLSSDAPTSTTQYPYSGIWIERVASLTIGHTTEIEGASLNTFQDFGQHNESNIVTSGVRSIQSNVTVKNSAFVNFGYQNPLNASQDFIESRGIYAKNNLTSVFQTTVIGLNQVNPSSPPNTFTNCYLDIRTLGTNLTVTDVTSYKAVGFIWASMDNIPQNPISCDIRNNKVDYFRALGIQISFYKPIAINIENNQFFDNDQFFDPNQRFGIVINALTADPEIALRHHGHIFNNKIRSRSILSGASFTGISISKTAYLTIEQNTITEQEVESNLNSFYGIKTWFSPTNGLRVLYNKIHGAGTNYIFAAGIDIRHSVNTILNCNSTDNLNTGILFIGNCDNADLRKNDFFYHERGLSVGHPLLPNVPMNQTGLQSDKENRWHGTDSPIEAFALNLQSAQASIFEINSSNSNSVFWPSPRKINTVDDNGTWFLPSTTGPEADENLTACYISYPAPGRDLFLADTDTKILDETFQPPLNYPALTWEAQWLFSDRLNRNPELHDSGNEAYYQSTYDETYSSLNRAYQAALNRWEPAHPLKHVVDSYADSINVAIAQRFALDEALSEDWQDNTVLHQQMAETDSAIVALSDSLNATIQHLNGLIDQQVNDLIAVVDTIVCTEVYETDMKDVIKTMLSAHLAGGQLTSTQTDRMKEIADKCRYSGGYAVLLARSFFDPQDSYIQDINCDEEEEELRILHPAEQPAPDEVIVFPNPAGDFLTIQTGQLFEGGTARFFNTQGMLLRHIELQGQSTHIPLNNLEAGMYYIDVILDGKPVSRKTFVVAR
ncbi:MAG: T9SS type A sorting domain-containing protein [Saprospiraceae bacterium]|nr:T9SS type A sorting domain-containing protein [Saprospiraceae bacterium]